MKPWSFKEGLYRDPFVEGKFSELMDQLELECREKTLRGLDQRTLWCAWSNNEEERSGLNNHLYLEFERFQEDICDHWNEVFERDPEEEEIDEVFHSYDFCKFVWIEVASKMLKVNQMDLLRLPDSEKEILVKSFKNHYHKEGKPIDKHHKTLFKRALKRVWSRNSSPRGFRRR